MGDVQLDPDGRGGPAGKRRPWASRGGGIWHNADQLGMHPTRVATRRWRSTLRVFAAFGDTHRGNVFDTEPSWYAPLPGQVRDREVQRARFAEAIGALPEEQVLGPVAAGDRATLAGRTSPASAESGQGG